MSNLETTESSPLKRSISDHFLVAALGIGAVIPLMPYIHKLVSAIGPSSMNNDLEGTISLFAIYLGYDLISKGCSVSRVGIGNLNVEHKPDHKPGAPKAK